MQVSLQTWQAIKDHFSKTYRRYQIRKKAISAAHGYGASLTHAQETASQVMNADALQALACSEMEDKEVMEKITSINLTPSQILNQAQDKILVLSKKLQAL